MGIRGQGMGCHVHLSAFRSERLGKG
ncbi:hypothetical protein IL54_2780 [Sphingobium sp. ba1]|nr:hypothetical protein IL54_2780 [Sphingobium sp. ba1]